MRNNTPPKKKMIGTSASDLAAQARSRANSAKVAANSAKVKANAKKVAANKMATAKVTPKEMDSIPMKNDAINKFSAKKTATVTPTPKAIETRGKSFLIENDRGIRQYGTALQADSALRSQLKWNEGGDIFPGAERAIGGNKGGTKQSYDATLKRYAKNPKMLEYYTTGPGKKNRAELPDYVPTKNTGGGRLLNKTEVYGSTGRGGCLPGFKLDKNGNCIRTSPL